MASAREKLTTIPAKIPANQHDPNAQRAILATQRRSPQMVLRLLAFNAEAWLAARLNAYLADDHEYRATLRHLLHLGGQIAYGDEEDTAPGLSSRPVTASSPTPQDQVHDLAFAAQAVPRGQLQRHAGLGGRRERRRHERGFGTASAAGTACRP